MKIGFAALVLGLFATSIFADVIGSAADEDAVRRVISIFAEGWNSHDAKKISGLYAHDADHVNVFGGWIVGAAELEKRLTALFSGDYRERTKTFTVEKIRFVSSATAIVHVKQSDLKIAGQPNTEEKNGNLSVYVLVKESGRWQIESFQNTSIAAVQFH